MREHRISVSREGRYLPASRPFTEAWPEESVSYAFVARRTRQLIGTSSESQGKEGQKRDQSGGVLSHGIGIDRDRRGLALAEWKEMLAKASEADEIAFAVLVEEFHQFVDGTDGLRGLSAAVGDVHRGALQAREVVGRYLGLCCCGGHGEFAFLKSVYQDVFEVAHRNLAVIARAANLALRGDARLHVDGLGFSLRQAAGHTTAGQRERWLQDFPKTRKLYKAIDRRTRNAIGHNKIHFDRHNNLLIYEDGTREIYNQFLTKLLYLPELTSYLQDISQTLTKPDQFAPDCRRICL